VVFTRRRLGAAALCAAAVGLAAAAPVSPSPASPSPASPAAPAAAAPAAARPAPAASSTSFSFPLINRSYSDLAPAAVPYTSGALSVALSSPRHNVVVREHRLTLTPLADGTHRADLDVTFLGKGWMVADVELAGFATQLADEVLLPSQRKLLQGRVRLEPAAGGGMLLTPVELPKTVQVAIQSRVGNQLVGWCEGISVLPLTDVDCGELQRAVQTATVPVPQADGPIHLDADELRPEDQAALEAYRRRAALLR
jgi:hypothetical protein